MCKIPIDNFEIKMPQLMPEKIAANRLSRKQTLFGRKKRRN
jgi:hypothetical protein